MLRNKAKLEIVSRILGRSSVAITLDVYRHIYDEEILEEVEPHGPTSDGQPALEREYELLDYYTPDKAEAIAVEAWTATMP